MKKTLLYLLMVGIYAPTVAQQERDTITGTRALYIVYNMKDKPLKAYQMPEDCYKYCYAHVEEGRKNQQVNLHYGYASDSVFWMPSKQQNIDDYLQPEGLTDKWLERDSVYVVMKEHFPLADRAYTRFRLADCRKYADNFGLKVIKLPYYKRNKRSYDRIAQIKRKRLGIKK